MLTTSSPRWSCTSGERHTFSKSNRLSSPKSRGARRKPKACLATPSHLFAYEDGSLPSDLPMSRLLRMSLHSLRGYLEITGLCCDPVLVTFAEVMVRQRFAQCRQLASFVEHYGYSPDDDDREIMSVRVSWVRALSELDQNNLRRFAEHVAIAEQQLEDACLETAMEFSCDSMRGMLHEFAMNIYGAQERIDEIATGCSMPQISWKK